MQNLEHLRRLFFYDLRKNTMDKEKSLETRQKKVRQKEDRKNPCF